MAAMMGTAIRRRRQGGWWWYCCQGHDGRWKDYIRMHRRGHRAWERREWQKEFE